jgi:hypothetical protein
MLTCSTRLLSCLGSQLASCTAVIVANRTFDRLNRYVLIVTKYRPGASCAVAGKRNCGVGRADEICMFDGRYEVGVLQGYVDVL